jgi:hydroxymethylbilane synthase
MIQSLLASPWPSLRFETCELSTQGDRTPDRPLPEIGGKGLFTEELETALRHGQIDLAVHSLKDLPIEPEGDLCLGAIPPRADARDVLVSRSGRGLQALPPRSTVGTSSLRRQAQLTAYRPDLDSRPLRGNVETRIRKVLEGEFDAAVLAGAGLLRLGLESEIAEWIPLEVMLPAPGQGALAIQCRADDREVLALLKPLDDPATRSAVTAERAFLESLGGGCSTPVGAYAQYDSDGLVLKAIVASTDGRRVIRLNGQGRDPLRLGRQTALQALAQGAEAVMALV